MIAKVEEDDSRGGNKYNNAATMGTKLKARERQTEVIPVGIPRIQYCWMAQLMDLKTVKLRSQLRCSPNCAYSWSSSLLVQTNPPSFPHFSYFDISPHTSRGLSTFISLDLLDLVTLQLWLTLSPSQYLVVIDLPVVVNLP